MKHLNEFLNEAKDVGHYERVGNQTIVDSNFVNYSKGCLPGSELVHLGMGDFQLKTPKGNITFNRSGRLEGIGQDFVGRPHRATDDKGGKVLEELIKVMTKKKKAVLSMSGMDESKKEITKYHKAAKKAGANKLSKIEPEYDDLYGHSFTFVDSDGDTVEIYYDKDQEGVAITQDDETDDISIEGMLKLIEQSGMNEAKKDYVEIKKEITKFHNAAKKAGAKDLSRIKLGVNDFYAYYFSFVDSDGAFIELYFDLDDQEMVLKQNERNGRVGVSYGVSIDSMLNLLEQSGMNEINQYTGEAEKSEKYWDTKFKKAIKLFPTWADEKRDITNEIRQVYNERVLDVIKGDKGYVEPIDRYENDAEVYIKFATDLWNKMKGDVIAKEYALEDYVRWLR